ncbi:hypothetical protein TVAG_491100 [Trichomonas vaginalis G3]|uniref:Uncharacterized protein n=1 Tax=Trichomonas vaginalis (strain ATCC PRA-98 / G3) TaxID=412133 RepID=A2E053_TRIV3|nr:hypothetical protein TVAGG3_0219200 [Trichomonas vaginalis G3]EAY13972.1 hypothetical protein TVAG_491100 [Trichomonas vaginalis G3]KAI5551790.1 hypothetical protein TVAGG3_0219200 [Trichomonas vaginalis G3]|eukprot:XP_001326195.1 hypothetical protein [Trichomonas vaginalis G3]
METPRGYGSSRKGSPLTIQDYKDRLGRIEGEFMELQMKFKAQESENSELKQRLQFISRQQSIQDENSEENTSNKMKNFQDELLKLKMRNEELERENGEIKMQINAISPKIRENTSPIPNNSQISISSTGGYQKVEELVILLEKATKECDQLNDRIKSLENDKKHDMAEINDLKRALKKQETDIPSLQIDQMDGILRENSELKQKIKELLEENTKVHKENLELKENLENIKTTDNNEKARLNDRIRSLESMTTDLKNKLDKNNAVVIQKPCISDSEAQIHALQKEISNLRDINDQQSIEIQDMKAQISQIDSLENEIKLKDARIDDLTKKLALPQFPTDKNDLRSMVEQLTKENGKLKAELRVKNYANTRLSPPIKEIDNDVLREKAAKYDHLITLYNEITNRYNTLYDRTKDYDDKTEIIMRLQKRVTQAEIDEQDFKRACFEYQQQISMLEKKLRELYALLRSYSVKYGIEFVEVSDYDDYIVDRNSPSSPTPDPLTQQRILKLENDVKELQNKLKMEEDSNIQLKELMNSKEIEIKGLREENSQLRESFIFNGPSTPPNHDKVDNSSQKAEIAELKKKIIAIYSQRDKDRDEIIKLKEENDNLAKINRKLTAENLDLNAENQRLLEELNNLKPMNKDSDIKEQTQEMEKFIAPSFNNVNNKPINGTGRNGSVPSNAAVGVRVQIEKAQKSQQELERLRIQIQQSEQTAKQSSNEIGMFKKLIAEKEQTILKLNDELIKLRNEILQREDNLKKLNDEFMKYKQKSTFETQSFDSLSQDFNNKIKDRDQHIEQCNEELLRIKSELQDSQKTNKSLNDQIKQLNDLISKLNDKLKLKDDEETISNELESKQEELNEAYAQIEKLNDVIRMNEKDLNDAETQIEDLRGKLLNMTNDTKDSDERHQLDIELKDQILELQKENIKLKEELSQVTSSPSNDKKAIIALRKQVSELQRMIDSQNNTPINQSKLSDSDIYSLQRLNRSLERKNIDLENQISELKLSLQRKLTLSSSVLELNDVVFKNVKIMLDRLSSEHKELINSFKDQNIDEISSDSDI